MNKRHQFLESFSGVKDEEMISYENMNICLLTVALCVCVFSLLEVASYFLYLFKFHPWIKIIEDGMCAENESNREITGTKGQQRKGGSFVSIKFTLHYINDDVFRLIT